MSKLNNSFYLQSDVVDISKKLLGKHIFTRLPLNKNTNKTALTGGIITETEAYAGPEDKASHAHGNRRTKRTEVMFHEGGISYVYLCYGMHSLFNIVTNAEDIPHAILIRSIQPTHGIPAILRRRNKEVLSNDTCAGPGNLTKALGINTSHNNIKLTGTKIWIEDRGNEIKERDIKALPRVGVDYAGTHAKRPWRFLIKKNKHVSK